MVRMPYPMVPLMQLGMLTIPMVPTILPMVQSLLPLAPLAANRVLWVPLVLLVIKGTIGK